jgi:predicted kinase
MLVLLNGPPASGKSTVVRRLVDQRPLALDLDIDLVRGQLGGWLDDTTAAGLAARALAIAMARTHLTAGHDVFVPQFLAQAGFAEELAAVAAECGAEFLSIALVIDRDTARSSFAARSHHPTESTHSDATAMVERSSTPDPIGAMFDRWCDYLDTQRDVVRVDAVRGEIEATVCAVEQVLTDAAGAQS